MRHRHDLAIIPLECGLWVMHSTQTPPQYAPTPLFEDEICVHISKVNANIVLNPGHTQTAIRRNPVTKRNGAGPGETLNKGQRTHRGPNKVQNGTSIDQTGTHVEAEIPRCCF